MVIYGNIYPYMANTERLVLRYTIYKVTIHRPISLTNLTRENCLLWNKCKCKFAHHKKKLRFINNNVWIFIDNYDLYYIKLSRSIRKSVFSWWRLTQQTGLWWCVPTCQHTGLLSSMSRCHQTLTALRRVFSLIQFIRIKVWVECEGTLDRIDSHGFDNILIKIRG